MKIKKIMLLLLLCLATALQACAQKLRVESFEEATYDMTARKHERLDTDRMPCAVVKVRVALSDVHFGINTIVGDVESNMGEYWVYMPKRSVMLQILHKDYTPLDVVFDDYGISALKSGTTYILTLVKPDAGKPAPADAGGNIYAISVQPKDAKVTVDGVLQVSMPDGQYSAMLPYGTHSYKVEAGGYVSQSGTFTVSSGEVAPISVSLVSALATVSVSCPTPAVSLYVDKKHVGTTPWTGRLSEGMHLIEGRKSGYRNTQQSVQLAQQQHLDIALGALVAIEGNLSVNYKPFGADVYIDGKRVGQSPRVYNGLLVGSHEVEVRKDGYATARHTVTIAEGQTANIGGTLTSASSSASSSQGSSSFASSSSSGGTITIPVTADVSIEMVRVEAGSFTMGATPEMKEPWNDEKPAHRVTLTNSYYMGKYEVTQALWRAVMGNNPSYFKGDNLPVEKVSWEDCRIFIDKLNNLTGHRFRLPTEAEWEFAARGGNKSCGYQYSGSNNLGDVAWYYGNSGRKTHAVGTKQANELGLYDMTGNVWEWCQDWKGSYPNEAVTNPTGPQIGGYRVNRGGCWYGDARSCRSSCRSYYSPGNGIDSLGLRLALSE